MDDEARDRLNVQRPSAPPVPKGLMSARPAMTKIRPQYPEQLAQAEAAKKKTFEPPQPTPEELEERQARLDYLKTLRGNEKPKKRWPKVVGIIVAALIVLGALGGAAYYWFVVKVDDTPTATHTTQSDSKATNTPQQTQNGTTPAETKDYTSTNFPVELKYPPNWTVNDTPTKLTITSPQLDLPAANGETLKGAAVFTIRNKQPSLPEFSKGNAVAVLPSENITYASPATGQRGSTYVSFLQYSATTAKGALDGIYITGNAGYQQGQAIPMVDVVKVDPLITVTFVSCTTTCSDASPAANVSSTVWTAASLQTILENMFKSLAIS
jgi:hypothetical protein